MGKQPARRPPRQQFAERLSAEVGEKETRKIRARREKHRTVWFGLGMFGLVGWPIAVCTLAGIALGLWLDAHHPGRYSWTLMLLVVGVAAGCLNAWLWLSKERRQIEHPPAPPDGEEDEGA